MVFEFVVLVPFGFLFLTAQYFGKGVIDCFEKTFSSKKLDARFIELTLMRILVSLIVSVLFTLFSSHSYSRPLGFDYFFGEGFGIGDVLLTFVSIAMEDLFIVLPLLSVFVFFDKPRLGVVVSGVVFSAIHLLNPFSTVLLFFGLLPSLVIGSFTLERYGYYPSAAQHVIYDGFLFLLMFLRI